MNLYTPKQLADSMRVVRKNTIAIAEDIPEDQYDYRPTQGGRSVRETASSHGFHDAVRSSHSRGAKAHLDGRI